MPPREERRRREEAIRITSAATSRNADIAARQRRYLLSMGLRSVCFIGAVTTAILGGPGVLTGTLIAAALVLPYVAVVLANVSASRADDFTLLGVDPQRPQLTGSSPLDLDRGTGRSGRP